MAPNHTPSTARSARRALLGAVRAVPGRVAAGLAAQDTAARARGWAVTVRRAGGRAYRDPRFNRLAGTHPHPETTTARGVR